MNRDDGQTGTVRGSEPAPPLGPWEWPQGVTVSAGPEGLINTTLVVEVDQHPWAVLQRLNTQVFPATVHEDIEVVTHHIAERGLLTPRLIRTRAGGLWHETPTGEVWRALTWVGDRTIQSLTHPAEARSGGRLLARFHRATADLRHAFHCQRPFHDTELRMEQLRAAVAQNRGHRLHDLVARVADALLRAWSDLEHPTDLPARVIHGDPKISNLRYQRQTAVALIDLDTLGRGGIDAELGDAFRSWCNPRSEDSLESRFDLTLFAAGIWGYVEEAGGEGLTPTEWTSIVPGIQRIALELAARFATDALEESYWAWDPRYGTRGEHNLMRARGQLALADSLRAQRATAERHLTEALGRIRHRPAGES